MSDCPVCGAIRDDRCCTINGEPLDKPHKGRTGWHVIYDSRDRERSTQWFRLGGNE